MKSEKIFWTDYSVLICTKCQKKIQIPADVNLSDRNGETNTELSPKFSIAESIKSEFKSALNDQGLKGKVRVMTSSCLGVCPAGSQALSVVSTKNPQKSLSLVFDPFKEKELALDEIKKCVSG